MSSDIHIRRASIEDAPSLVAIWQTIAVEKIYSSVDEPFTIEQQREYLQSLTEREAIFVAEIGGKVVGCQTFDLWARTIHSMSHVAQLGTFVLPEWRGRGIGAQLAEHTLAFARSNGYEKIVIAPRASNTGAQRFYSRLGFKPSGCFHRQVKIDGKYDDEILMELFLNGEQKKI